MSEMINKISLYKDKEMDDITSEREEVLEEDVEE